MDIVEKDGEENWNFKALSYNENLNFNWYLKYQCKDWDYKVLYDRFISTGNISIHKFYLEKVDDWVLNFPTDKLNYELLSTHKYLDLRWIHAHKTGNWNFSKISYLKSNSILDYDEFLNKKWLLDFPDESWDPDGLIEQPMFDISWLLVLPNLNWNIKKITYQIDEITLDHIRLFPDFINHRKWLRLHKYITKKMATIYS